MKNKYLFAVISFVALVTSSVAEIDEKQVFLDDIASGAVGQNPRTYYIRSRTELKPQLSNATFSIVGNSTYNESGAKVFGTRIVGGIGIPRRYGTGPNATPIWKTYDDLDGSDTWKTRFWGTIPGTSTNVRDVMRWIDLDEYATTHGRDGGTTGQSWETDQQEVWFPRWRRLDYDQAPRQPWPQVIEAESIDQRSIYNFLTATVDGISMKYAELSDTVLNPKTRWLRAASGTATSANIDIDNAFGTTSSFATFTLNQDLMCTMFPNYDYKSKTMVPTSIYGILSIVKGAGGTVLGYTVNLPVTPFNSGHTFNEHQRLTLWNAPEFLRKPGTFVMQTELKRIYFIPPATPSEEDLTTVFTGGITAENYVGEMLEVSSPRYQSTEQIWDYSLAIDKNGPYNFSQGLVADVIFSNGAGSGLVVSDQDNITINHCVFRNFGNRALHFRRSKNCLVANSTFRSGYGGQIVFDQYYYNGVPFNRTSFSNPNFALETFADVSGGTDFVNLTPTNNIIGGSVPGDLQPGSPYSGNRFEQLGMVFPEQSAIQTNGYLIGATISGNTFVDIGGAAITLGGLNNKILGNNFQDCVKDVTDYSAIYFGRTWMNLGNRISGNHFQGIFNRTSWDGSLSAKPETADNVNAVMIDDLSHGFLITDNHFEPPSDTYLDDPLKGLARAVKINNGAFHIVASNTIDGINWSHASSTSSSGNPKPVTFGGVVSFSQGNTGILQNYRELGALLWSPGILSNPGQSSASFNQHYHDMFLEHADESNLLFTAQDMENYYISLMVALPTLNSWRMAVPPFDTFSSVQGSGFTGPENGLWHWTNHHNVGE